MQVSEDLVRSLPKTDLHLHLDGSLRLESMLELAREQGIKLPAESLESLGKQLRMGDGERSLERYLSAFDHTLSVLQEKEALQRCAYELALDNQAEGVRYLEVRFAPQLHVSAQFDAWMPLCGWSRMITLLTVSDES